MRGRTVAAALLFAILSQPALAQSPADHQNHDHGHEQAPASPQSTPPANPSTERQNPSRAGDMLGMMGRGMMGQGMKGHGAAGGEAMEPPVAFRIIFALMDADGDGTVSLPEFQVAHERIFKAMDINKDGKLTPDEMTAFMHRSKGAAPQQ
ncbi:EF-hand domain-containing protein [Bradyrhizobium sp. U531]|uniref:EF-hand domain-containing protein n=1 Tax=Bradyrhizobium sp. U531 TaxID=3053458 RepID=UPI003F4373F2